MLKNYTDMLPHIESREYATNLWNTLRGRRSRADVLSPGLDLSTSSHVLSAASHDKYMVALK